MIKTESDREARIRHLMKSCVHFNGIQHDKCGAGINIREMVAGPDFGWAARIPCIITALSKEKAVCPSISLPTREEAEKEYDNEEVSFDRHMKAFRAAHDDAKAKGFKIGNGGMGSIPCPMECGGQLRYSVARVNGHMHAACSTKGCVSWME